MLKLVENFNRYFLMPKLKGVSKNVNRHLFTNTQNPIFKTFLSDKCKT